MPYAPRVPPQWILERLQKTLIYDPESGWVTWIKPLSNRCRVGDRAGSPFYTNRNPYRRIVVARRECGRITLRLELKEHHVCWFLKTGRWPETELDHKDRDGTNNKWENLRPATRSQQMQNSSVRRDSPVGVKGVTCYRRKYVARIRVDGKSKHLGVFDTIEAASAAYRSAALRYYDSEFHYAGP